MEEKYGGGLTDILRVNGEAMIITTEEEEESPEEENGVDINNNINYDWQFQNNVLDDFGDPFSNFQDPLLLLQDHDHGHDHDHDIQTQDSRLFFNNNNSDIDSSINLAAAVPVPKIDDDGDQLEELIIRQPWPTNNLLARMFQISPPNTKLLPGSTAVNVALQRGLKSPLLAAVNDPMINSCCNSKVDKGGLHLQQISSPPSNAGIKRRKSQVKKVLCVPATAPTSNSRPTTSEVVPSDLWAWRKYGQKPIKGSPYPRSYYRCSSSKGCPAKKQVERSRTDPNMLVITYTCEHNHPWPNSQRNALAAGSTKTAIPKSKNSSNSKSQKAATHCRHDVNQPSVIITGNSSYTSHCVKIKEMEEDFNKPTKMGNDEFSDVFRQSYRPVSPQEDKSEDFFAELGELESDPMNLLFSNGYSEVEARENKSLDPFTFYDWAGSGNNITTSQEEDKMGS